MRAVLSRRVRSYGLIALGVVLLAIAWASLDLAGSAERLTAWIVEMQRELHVRLAAAVRAVHAAGPEAAWPLVALSFAYGVFHAAGPGHGKMVIATYLTTQRSSLPRALMLTGAAALAQAVTAIVVAQVSVSLLGLSLREARGSSSDLELVSFALVVALGGFLAFRALRALRHAHVGEACHTCGGHAHAPPPPGGLWADLGVIASIGIRPCAGALVVLLLAHAAGLVVVGIVAVLAMALGTALATGALAALAVLARHSAVRLARLLPEGTRLERWANVVALVGGLVIVGMGLLLLHAAWTTPAHPFR